MDDEDMIAVIAACNPEVNAFLADFGQCVERHQSKMSAGMLVSTVMAWCIVSGGGMDDRQYSLVSLTARMLAGNMSELRLQ